MCFSQLDVYQNVPLLRACEVLLPSNPWIQFAIFSILLEISVQFVVANRGIEGLSFPYEVSNNIHS